MWCGELLGNLSHIEEGKHKPVKAFSWKDYEELNAQATIPPMENDTLAEELAVTITPEVLKWARENVGYSVAEIAELMQIDTEEYVGWENGTNTPTLSQLRELSGIVNQSLAFFFRGHAPKVTALPKDLRTLPREDKILLSPETKKVIREVQSKQEIYIELLDEKRKNPLVGSVQSYTHPEEVANHVREKLGITCNQQSQWASEYVAFGEWREILEKHGFLVFQYKMPVDEARGFSIADDVAPLIITNKEDHVRSQIFTLFHEMAHLLLNEGGICIPDRWSSSGGDNVSNVEVFCNHFAGAFLVPESALFSHKYLRDNQEIAIDMERRIGGIANSFWVSKEVIIRRLLTFEKISKNEYKNWRETRLKNIASSGGGGGRRDIANECVNRYGKTFASVVLDSYRHEKISYIDIADSLNIKTKYIPRVEKLVEG